VPDLNNRTSRTNNKKTPTVQEVVIELKTGNLLVADWFRLDEFTKTVDTQFFDLNSGEGREAQARYYAEQFGFVSVSVGNSSPRVFQAGNLVVVGHHKKYDEEDDWYEDLPAPAPFNVVTEICTDLWAATLVEYERLIEVVAQKRPSDARSVVDEFLGGSFVEPDLKVDPGIYYLYFYGGYPDYFKDEAAESGLDLPEGIKEPYFVLSKTRLLNHPV
jgi:hypothetical protein